MLNSLFKKNFLIFFTIFIFSFSILYVFIYNYMPLYYLQMQENRLDNESKKVVETLQKEEGDLTIESFQKIDQNIKSNYYVVNDQNQLIFFYDQYRNQGYIWENGAKIIDEGKELQELSIDGRFLTRQYYLETDSDTYQINFSTPLDNVDGIREVLYIIIPYMILLGLVLALLTSYIFATIISKPIIKLNQHALEIANLKFKKHKPLDRNDEIGVLSYNLVVMSNHLEQAVEGFKSDIDQVSKRDKERKELMAILSHELKTPITILSGQTECMINGIGKYKDYKKYLKENLKEFDRLNNLVNQILDLSKVDNFDYEVKTEKIKLDKFIQEKCREYETIYADKQLKCKLKLKRKNIHTDRKLIDFILKNLIENAFKYSNENSEINIETNENFIEISNEIKGEMKMTEQELMSPFIQNDESRKAEGHGLGLYIVSKSIEQLSLSYHVNVIDNRFIFKIFINNNLKKGKNNKQKTDK